MKIRVGFVSNSSSSSFLIFGKKVNIENITPEIIKEKSIIVIGMELGDGDDVFYINTVEELAFLKAYNEYHSNNNFYNELTFIDVYSINVDRHSGELDLTKSNDKKIEFYNINSDNHSSQDIYELRSRYDSENELRNLENRYIRNYKLQNINKLK